MITAPIQGLGSIGHPGIFMGQGSMLGLKNHVDIPYVTSLAPETPYNFGVLDIWALKQRTNSPLLTFALDNAQVIYTGADYYEFSLPTAIDTTNRLVSGGLDRDKFGMDGEEIPFVVTKRDLSGGSIFKFDLTSRVSFTVVDRKIEQLGEQFKVYAVLNTNAFVKYVTKAEFTPGRQIIKIADIRGLDFSSNKSVWQLSGGGVAKYKNYLSNAKLQQSYRVSSGAVEYLNSDTRITGDKIRQFEDTVLQFYQVKGIADNRFIKLNNTPEYQSLVQQVAAQKAAGNGEAAMVNLLDSIAITMLQRQNNDLMVWSDQIDILRDGYDTMRLVPGVWFQMDLAGYKHTFSIENFTLETITDAIKDFERGKVPERESVSDNVYTIKTGKGGAELIWNEFVKKGFANVPGVIQNAEFKFVEGPNAANLTRNIARFTKYQLPNIGYLQVDYEPGFDPVMADEFVNPILAGGYRLSSYTMLIEDYDTSRGNMAVFRRKGSKLRMMVEAGDETHPLLRTGTNINGNNIQVHAATDELSGYQVKFVGGADTAIVIDPTKLLKLVPKNPRTGIAAL